MWNCFLAMFFFLCVCVCNVNEVNSENYGWFRKSTPLKRQRAAFNDLSNLLKAKKLKAEITMSVHCIFITCRGATKYDNTTIKHKQLVKSTYFSTFLLLLCKDPISLCEQAMLIKVQKPALWFRNLEQVPNCVIRADPNQCKMEKLSHQTEGSLNLRQNLGGDWRKLLSIMFKGTNRICFC